MEEQMYALVDKQGDIHSLGTIEECVARFAQIAGVDVEPDWEEGENALGFGWIAGDGTEYGIVEYN